MQKYPSFCLRQKSPPAGRVSGWAGKAVHVLGKALILCWCAFTVALIGWVVLASFTPTRDIFQNDLLAAGLDLSGDVYKRQAQNSGKASRRALHTVSFPPPGPLLPDYGYPR